jgi:hypothetical protein
MRYLLLFLFCVPAFAQNGGNQMCSGTITGTIAATVLTVTGTPGVTLEPGQLVVGTSVTSGTTITSLGTGTGGTGTYNLNNSSTVTVGETMTVSLPIGNGWTLNKCQLAFTFSATTVVNTISPTSGHGVLVGGYVCGNSSCNSAPQATIAIKDNINNPEGCFTASPNSPHLANSTVQQTRWYWWYCPSIPSGVTSITITNTNGAFGGALWVVDISGGPASSPFDSDGFSVNTTATASPSVAVTTLNATDLVFGMLDSDASSGNNGVTSGYLALLNDGTGSTTFGGTGVLQAKSQTAANTYTITSSYSPSSTGEGYAAAIKALSTVVNPPSASIF